MGGKCLNEVIDLTLRKIFYRHGKLVGNHPGYFIVVIFLYEIKGLLSDFNNRVFPT